MEKWTGGPTPKSPQLCLRGTSLSFPSGFTDYMFDGLECGSKTYSEEQESPHRPQAEDGIKLTTETASCYDEQCSGKNKPNVLYCL